MSAARIAIRNLSLFIRYWIQMRRLAKETARRKATTAESKNSKPAR
jgi:hypothetical protein